MHLRHDWWYVSPFTVHLSCFLTNLVHIVQLGSSGRWNCSVALLLFGSGPFSGLIDLNLSKSFRHNLMSIEVRWRCDCGRVGLSLFALELLSWCSWINRSHSALRKDYILLCHRLKILYQSVSAKIVLQILRQNFICQIFSSETLSFKSIIFWKHVYKNLGKECIQKAKYPISLKPFDFSHYFGPSVVQAHSMVVEISSFCINLCKKYNAELLDLLNIIQLRKNNFVVPLHTYNMGCTQFYRVTRRVGRGKYKRGENGVPEK